MRFSVESRLGTDAKLKAAHITEAHVKLRSMATIQVMIDESLLAEVQLAADALQMTRLDFMKVAVERAVQQRETIALERQHAQDYLEPPPNPEKKSRNGKVNKSRESHQKEH
jgi:hypothetical protein